MDTHILDTYAELGSGNLTARRLGISSVAVYSALKRHAVQLVWKRGKARATDESIIQAYSARRSGIAVAKTLRVSEKTVYEVLAKHKIPTIGLVEYRARIRKFSSTESDRLVRDYSTGLSASKLAVVHGCSTGTVLNALKARGVTIRSSTGRLSEQEQQRAETLYRDGMTLGEVGIVMRRALATVARYLHKAHKSIIRPLGPGPASPTWNGGRNVSHGYMNIWVAASDPMASMRHMSGYVMEHRLVMARVLGRPLLRTETVHHIDGDKLNNVPANLQLRQGKHGKGIAMCCHDCGSRNVGPLAIREEQR